MQKFQTNLSTVFVVYYTVNYQIDNSSIRRLIHDCINGFSAAVSPSEETV